MYKCIICLIFASAFYLCAGKSDEANNIAIPKIQEETEEQDEPLRRAESRLEIEMKILTQLVEKIDEKLKNIDSGNGSIKYYQHHVLPGKTNETAAPSCVWLNERFYNLRSGMFWTTEEGWPKPTYCDFDGEKVIRFPNAVYGGPISAENGTEYYIQGHVEILHNHQWGAICGGSWWGHQGDQNANVLCKMGGYKRGMYDYGKYRQAGATKSEKKWLSELYCNGDESNVDECWGVYWPQYYCSNRYDVGIRCYI